MFVRYAVPFRNRGAVWLLRVSNNKQLGDGHVESGGPKRASVWGLAGLRGITASLRKMLDKEE